LRVLRPIGGKGAPHPWHRFAWGAWLDLLQPAHNLNPRLSNTAPQPAHFVYWPRGANLKLHATVALYALNDVVGRGIKIRPAAMAVEFEFFTMRGYSRHNRLCCSLSAFERRGGQDIAHDHARIHVPGLRLKAELDGDLSLARLAEKVV